MPDNHNAILPMFFPMAEKPKKKYHTIVADPPWRYDSKLVGLRGATDYPTMTQEELMCMPIGLWAEDRAHLYLWTTTKFIVDAHHIAKAWGFEPQNILTWVKGRSESEVTMSVGFYYRHATEFILFAVRDSLTVLEHNQPDVFFAPRKGHSEKPDTFYDIVERMSIGPYLDVFARKQRFKWDTFGNESFNFGTELPPHHFMEAKS